MPVYMRKQEDSLDLSKFEDEEPDIDADFVTDPEKFRDHLPQPYRFIDGVLESLLEVAFQDIFHREEERDQEENKYKPPAAPADLFRQVKDISDVKFLIDSTDEKFVFCSTSNSILALGVSSLETVAKYEFPELEICFISVARLNDNLYLLATLDDCGLARLFLFDTTNFYLVKSLNEDEGDNKILCLQLQLAEEGEFVAMTMQNASNKQVCLEFLRLPLEAWAKELEQQTGRSKDTKNPIAEERGADAPDDAADPAGYAQTRSDDPSSSRGQLKLSPATLCLRVRPPPATVASSATSPSFKAVDASGDVIGSGAAHLLTQQHLQLREANFLAMHHAELQQLPDSSIRQQQQVLPTAHVIFARPGRQLGHDAASSSGSSGSSGSSSGSSSSSSSSSSEQRACAACVAWAGDHRLMIYSLLRTGKDPEFKAESVWTYSSAVTCLSASHCKSQLAVGLQNGNASFHDLHLGLLREVVTLPEQQPIRNVFFLNPAAFPEASDDVIYKSEQSQVAVTVTGSSEARMHLVRIGGSRSGQLQQLPTSTSSSYAQQLVLQPRSHPALLLRATSQGHILLHDLSLPRDELQFSPPAAWCMREPWLPGSWCLAGNGDCLAVRAYNEEAGTDAIFVCNLRILIPMAKYWPKQLPMLPCSVRYQLHRRCDAFLQHRSKSHSRRQEALAEIWSGLSDTLKQLQAEQQAEMLEPLTARSANTAMSNRSGDSRLSKLHQLQLQHYLA